MNRSLRRVLLATLFCVHCTALETGDSSSDGGQAFDRDAAMSGSGGSETGGGMGGQGGGMGGQGGGGSGIEAGGSGAASGSGGSSSDAGIDSSTPEACEPEARRCEGPLLRQCEDDGVSWRTVEDCAATHCNPIALDCYACEAEVTADGALSCAAARALEAGPAVAELTTSDEPDGNTGTCGGAGSPDRVIEFVAPATDYYVLDSAGSIFDTVLYARDCACDGVELACNNNASGAVTHSEIITHLERGQRIAVVMDGNAGAHGRAVLNVSAVSCPAFDLALDSLPATIADAGGDGIEQLRFVPVESGFYSIRMKTATGSVAACLQYGPRCGGTEIACNSSSGRYGAQIVRELQAGQPMTLEVELTAASSFELSIERLEGAVCEDLSVFDATPPTTNGSLTSASSNNLTASCAPAGLFNPNDSAEVPQPEARYIFSTDANDVAPTVFVVEVESEHPLTVYLLGDGCGGSELACDPGAFDAANGLFEASVDIAATGQARDYVVVIERGVEIPPVSPFTFSAQMRVLQ